MTTWIEALKIWNGKRGGKKYMIPRKDTEEHAQVMSIMKGQQNGKGLVQLGVKAPKKKGKKPPQKGGEVIDPNVDLISEINDLWTSMIGLGLTQPQKNRLKKRIKGGMIDPRDLSVVSRMSRDLTKKAKKQKGGLGWTELSAVNEVLYPLQPKLPGLDTKTGKPVPPSTPFDFLNITF